MYYVKVISFLYSTCEDMIMCSDDFFLEPEKCNYTTSTDSKFTEIGIVTENR
jgi:hypothetical protein